MNKIIITVLILFLITISITSVLLFLSGQNEKTAINGLIKSENTVNQPSKSLFSLKNDPTPTPSWKIYKEQKLRYEIEYPASWSQDSWNIQDAVNVKSTADGNIWGHTRLYDNKDKRLEIIAWGNRTKTPILQWLQWYRHEDLDLSALPKELNYNFQDRPALRFVHENTSFTYPVVHIIIQQNDKLYEILYRMDSLKGVQKPLDSQLIDSPYDEMLQSFKFIP